MRTHNEPGDGLGERRAMSRAWNHAGLSPHAMQGHGAPALAQPARPALKAEWLSVSLGPGPQATIPGG